MRYLSKIISHFCAYKNIRRNRVHMYYIYKIEIHNVRPTVLETFHSNWMGNEVITPATKLSFQINILRYRNGLNKRIAHILYVHRQHYRVCPARHVPIDYVIMIAIHALVTRMRKLYCCALNTYCSCNWRAIFATPVTRRHTRFVDLC